MDYDELGIQDVVELLRDDEADVLEIPRAFGDKKPGDDHVIHFYEHFLSAYNKKLKIQRGVFYTPQPDVSYIVRSVHELLQTEFGLEDGLAPTVTGGEMVKTSRPRISPISNRQGVESSKGVGEERAGGGLETRDTAGWNPALRGGRTFTDYWNAHVAQHRLPRLHGYELLAAPYAIAHLKPGLKLTETGEVDPMVWAERSPTPRVHQDLLSGRRRFCRPRPA